MVIWDVTSKEAYWWVYGNSVKSLQFSCKFKICNCFQKSWKIIAVLQTNTKTSVAYGTNFLSQNLIGLRKAQLILGGLTQELESSADLSLTLSIVWGWVCVGMLIVAYLRQQGNMELFYISFIIMVILSWPQKRSIMSNWKYKICFDTGIVVMSQRKLQSLPIFRGGKPVLSDFREIAKPHGNGCGYMEV